MLSPNVVLDLRNLGDIYDDSRYHHTITNNNGVVVRGMHGRGVYFNGIDAYLDCGNLSSLTTDAITVEAWVNFLNTYRQAIVEKGGGGLNKENYVLLTGSTNVSAFAVHDGSTLNIAQGQVLSSGIWYHVVGTHDGTTLNIYTNGIVGTPAAITITIPTSTDVLMIGRMQRFLGDLCANGIISSARIYNYALSADEIKLHYRQQSPYYQQEAPTIIL